MGTLEEKALIGAGLISETELKRVTNPIDEHWPPEQTAPNPLGAALDAVGAAQGPDVDDLDDILSPRGAIAAELVMRAVREARCSCAPNHQGVIAIHATDCWRPFLDAMIRKSDAGRKM